jgi:opacity protein-like surface antigen
MKKLLIASAITLALSSTSAFAVSQQSGVYGTVLGGWSFASAPNATNAGSTSTSNKNYTWGGNLGYQYAFNQNWAAALEIGYVSFGKTEYNGTNSGKIQNTGAQAMLVGSYMMNNGFNGFVKAGGMNAYSKASPFPGGPSVALNNGNTQIAKWIPVVAAGVGYMPMQNLNVALQYEHTFGSNWNVAGSNDNLSKPMTQNAVTLNLTYLIPLSF